ncbi:MAG: response regulator [Candidatus Binatia bacterium]
MAEKILVVEDDSISLSAVSRYLQIMGYEVEQAGDGLEALDKLENHSFDLVLSDIMMPKIDGLLLTKHIRTRFPCTPIILMTADPPEPPSRVVALTGARYLLAKPLMLDELLEKIRSTLDPPTS